MRIGTLQGILLIFGSLKMRNRKLITALVAASVAFSVLSPVVAARYTQQYERASERLLSEGIALVSQKRFEEATKLFEQAAVADPKNARAFAYLGYCHQQTDNEPEAQKYFGIALAINPDELNALNWGGQSDLSSEDLDSALLKLDRLSRICGEACREYQELYAAVDAYKAKATN